MSIMVIYALEDCPYSDKALELLKEHDIYYKRIKVTPTTKQKFKQLNKMDTFPQLFIIKSGNNKKENKRIKIGGSDDLLHLIQISHLMKFNDISHYKVKEFLDIY